MQRGRSILEKMMRGVFGSLLLVLLATGIPVLAKVEGDSIPIYSDWKLELIEGEAYLQKRELLKAEQCFTHALKLIKKSTDRSTNTLVLCMENLAKVLYMQEELEESLKLYRKALSTLEKEDGKDSISLVPTLKILGGIYEFEGDYKKAGKYYQRALAITDEVNGATSLASADCQHLLGRNWFKDKQISKARDCYSIALANLMQQPSLPDDKFLPELLSDYIDLLAKNDQATRVLQSKFQIELLRDELGSLPRKKGVSASSFSREVSVRIKDDGSTGGDGAHGVSTGGDALPSSLGVDVPVSISAPVPDGDSGIAVSRKLADQAALESINRQRILFYERMIEVDIKSLGRDHPSVARDLTGLANVYISQKRFEEAKPFLLRALKIYQKAYVDESAMIKQTKMLLQLISEEVNPDSNYHFASYVANLPKIPLEAQNLEVALRLNYLAFVMYCQGNIREAKQVLYWALASTARASGEQSMLSAASMSDLSRLLRLTGQSQEALKFENNARAILRQSIAEKRARLLP